MTSSKNSKTETGLSAMSSNSDVSSLADKFDEILQKFYSDLLKRQVRLDPECQKILDDNLWDLYEKD